MVRAGSEKGDAGTGPGVAARPATSRLRSRRAFPAAPDVASQAARDASYAKFEAACENLAKGGSIQVLTHRMANDDISARLKKARRWTVWSFPVIAQEFEMYQCGDHGRKVQAGALLDGSMWSPGRIAQLQDLLSEAEFAAHYLHLAVPSSPEA